MTDTIKTLEETRALDSPERVAAFDRAVQELPRTLSSADIERLLKVFDDNTPWPDVMFTLVHRIEDTPVGVEERALVRSLPTFAMEAPWWAGVLTIGILNEPASRDALVGVASTADARSREALLGVLARIASESHDVGHIARDVAAAIDMRIGDHN
jgi:hypothetical protein